MVCPFRYGNAMKDFRGAMNKSVRDGRPTENNAAIRARPQQFRYCVRPAAIHHHCVV